MNALATIKGLVGGARDAGSDTECQGKCRHRVKTPVEPEYEFVEIRRQMLRAHSVVRSQQPRFQIGENEVNHRERFLGFFGVAAESHGLVPVADRWEVIVPQPAICDDLATRLNAVRYKRLQGVLAAITDDPQAQATRVNITTPSRDPLVANLNCTNPICLVVNPRPSPRVLPPTKVSSTSTGHSAPIRS